MKYKKPKRRTKYLSDEYRAAVIQLAKEVCEAFAKTHKEVSELDLPSDYNDPEQLMIYDELEYLLSDIDNSYVNPYVIAANIKGMK